MSSEWESCEDSNGVSILKVITIFQGLRLSQIDFSTSRALAKYYSMYVRAKSFVLLSLRQQVMFAWFLLSLNRSVTKQLLFTSLVSSELASVLWQVVAFSALYHVFSV